MEFGIRLDEDSKLMLKVAAGDNDAYTALCKKFSPIVAHHATKRNGHSRVSEDIAQEVLIRVYDDRAKYRPMATFRTWLFTYAENVIHEYHRRFTEQLDDSLEIIDGRFESSEITVQNRELAEIIENAKSKLPPKQQQVVELAYFRGLPPNEIAEKLQCSISSVYDNLYKARKNLRKKLADNCFDDNEI